MAILTIYSASLFTGILFLGLLVYAAIYTILDARITAAKYQHLPWLGSNGKTWWHLLKARISNVIHLQARHESETRKYSSQGLACFCPSAIGDHIIIPAEEQDWLLAQSTQDLSQTIALDNELQAEATIGEPFMFHADRIRDTVVKSLNKNLAPMTAALYEDIANGIDKLWGLDTDNWKEVNLLFTILEVITIASSRAYVGMPLCEDQSFIQNSLSYASTLFPCSITIRQVPKPLQRFINPFITLSNRYYRKALHKSIKSEVSQRLKELERANNADEKNTGGQSGRNDFLQWLIEAAFKSGSIADLDSYILTQRIVVLQFLTMYPTSDTATETLIEILSQTDAHNLVSELRQEINDVLKANENTWSKQTVNRLYNIDSCVRENLRTTPMTAWGSGRRVTAKGGMTTPITNTYLPENSTVAIPSYAIQHDPENFQEPKQYKPLRFAGTDQAETGKAGTVGSKSVTSLDKTFTTFGGNKHACPGRFFAADEIKLLLAYVIQNYDFEYLPERPSRMWAGHLNVPPMSLKIKIRRRGSV